jgi:hypothetical protein
VRGHVAVDADPRAGDRVAVGVPQLEVPDVELVDGRVRRRRLETHRVEPGRGRHAVRLVGVGAAAPREHERREQHPLPEPEARTERLASRRGQAARPTSSATHRSSVSHSSARPRPPFDSFQTGGSGSYWM